jgi:VanZ family protein
LTILFILVLVLILHLSFYPWSFHGFPPGHNPFWILLHSRLSMGARREVFDVVSNVALYVPLGVTGYLASVRRRRGWAAAAGTMAVGIALSSGVEIGQLAAVNRHCSLADVASNTCGTALGIALALVFRRYSPGGRPNRAITGVAPGALLLVGCWVGFQLYPLMPDTSLGTVIPKLRMLLTLDSFSSVVLLVSVADWVAVDALLRRSAAPARVAPALAILFLLAAARPLIVGRTISWPELAALPLALLARRAFPEAGYGRALFLTAALALNGLAPFHLASAPAAFQWAPFRPLIADHTTVIAPIVFLKAFRYGVLVWLLRAAGRSFAAAGTTAAVFLGAVEVAQIYVAGHVPELTDPLLAAGMAVALAAFERLGPVRASSCPRGIPSSGAPACRPSPGADSAG